MTDSHSTCTPSIDHLFLKTFNRLILRLFRAKRFEHANVSTQDALNMLFLTITHLVNAFFV